MAEATIEAELQSAASSVGLRLLTQGRVALMKVDWG